MATTKFKKKDLNRLKKVYPYIRKKPVFGLLSDKEVVIEVGSLYFDGIVDSRTYDFEATFDGIPTITAIAVDTEGYGDGNVNVFVSEITTQTATIATSQKFTGRVHFHVIYIPPTTT